MKGKFLLCIIFLFSLSVTCVYAQDKEDLSLFEIDRLIRKTEYDEALRQLNIYLKNKPDNFDNAQIRIRRIMNARKQYSILAEELIELIEKDPGNNKKIYEITAQLEKFERHPSDQNLQFIADLKKSAEFNYFRAQFLEIQNQTAFNTKNGKYAAAMEKAKEGFWLYRDDFDEKWEDNQELIADVNSIVNDINLQIAAFEEKNFIPKFTEAVNEFIKVVNQDQYELALERFTVVQNYMQNLNKIRNAIVSDGEKMQKKFAQLQELDSDTSDASFLPFMFRFVYGIDSIPDSGILNALDGQWNEYSSLMNAAVFQMLTKKYDNYVNGINQNYVDSVKKYVALQNKVLDLNKIAQTNEQHPLKNQFESYYVLADYVENLSVENLRIINIKNQVVQTHNSQNTILNQIQNNNSSSQRATALTQLFSSNSKLGTLVGVKESQKLENCSWTQKYREGGYENWNALSENYSNTLESIFTETAVILNSAWSQITQFYKINSDTIYSIDSSFTQAASDYNQGFFTKIPDNVVAALNSDISKAVDYEKTFNYDPELDFGINYSYPDFALKIAKYVQKKIDQDMKVLTGYQNEIKSNFESDQQWKSDENLVAMVNEADAYVEQTKEKLTVLKVSALSQANLAQTKITASQLARNEADIRYNEAENALKNENFDIARKKLQDALSKYDEALNNQNDESLRSQVDIKLQSLGERIAKGENEIVVREVRDLKTRAKDAYFNGRFDDAEKLLNQAKIRWAVTNVQEDEEITNLLSFVNTAISMKTGRDILPSAPQYPEMSQLLNMAYQYFDEGSRKIGEGNKEEGMKDLDLAMESIQKLQYVYPLNQEAALLTLRINRLKDPKKFADEFAQKIETAKMMCKSVSTRQEGYANLLDYYELQPDYKGLKDLIYQVEIDIGIRQKPVDNSGTNKANKLIKEAQNIYKSAGTDTKKLQQALAKIDQALALVSDNKTAISLKDEITTKIGGTTSTVLSTEDERMYQLAIQRLQNNNVVGANAIVQQLLRKPANANSQKIQDLKNKIDARS